jgi:hypothetical protein
MNDGDSESIGDEVGPQEDRPQQPKVRVRLPLGRTAPVLIAVTAAATAVIAGSGCASNAPVSSANNFPTGTSITTIVPSRVEPTSECGYCTIDGVVLAPCSDRR